MRPCCSGSGDRMAEILQSEIINPLLSVIQVGILFRVIFRLIAAHGDEQDLSLAIRQCKKLILAGGIAVCMTDIVNQIRTSFSVNNMFDGIRALLHEAAAALTLFEMSYIIFILVSTGIAWQQDMTDESGIYRKKLIHTLLIGALVVTATQTVPIIFSYFT